jgi:hypothetical protein
MTAGSVEKRAGQAAFLTIKMGNYWHSQWFIVYPRIGYDLILGKDFMEGVTQKIDLIGNVLRLPNCSLKGLEL